MQLENSFVQNLCCGRLLTSDAVMEYLKEKLPAAAGTSSFWYNLKSCYNLVILTEYYFFLLQMGSTANHFSYFGYPHWPKQSLLGDSLSD
jgi:hypothetical protein